jgi:drug/metabolite transporter (DMT)-like permease
MKESNTKYYILLLFAVVAWGSSYPVVRFLVQGGIHPYLLAFTRTTISLGVITGFLAGQRTSPGWTLFKKNWLLLTLMGMTGIFGFHWFMNVGLQYTQAGKSTLINGINPVLIVLLAALILKEQITKGRVAGMIISLSGLILVVTANGSTFSDHFSFVPADLLFICTACCWSAYSIINRILAPRIAGWIILFWAFAIGSLLLFPWAVPHLTSFLGISPLHLLWLLYLGIVPAGIGYYFWYVGIAKLGAATGGLFNTFLPLSAIIISALWLGEKLQPLQYIGGILLIGGVWLALLAKGKK